MPMPLDFGSANAFNTTEKRKRSRFSQLKHDYENFTNAKNHMKSSVLIPSQTQTFGKLHKRAQTSMFAQSKVQHTPKSLDENQLDNSYESNYMKTYEDDFLDQTQRAPHALVQSYNAPLRASI